MTSHFRTLVCTAVACAAMLITAGFGCHRQPPSARPASVGRGAANRRANTDVLLSGIATTLNDLSNRVDLELNPEQPILTARTSDDGAEVLAVCSASPYQPDGPNNYMQVPVPGFDFRAYDVKPGDIVRYYVNVDAEAAEIGFEDRKAVRLTVRRVDQRNPSALVLQEGLSGPVVEPQRIEIWRLSDERLDAISNILQRYYGRRRPAVGWEPSPDEGELQRLVERCNQWWRNQTTPNADWRVDPLLDTLPEGLRSNQHVIPQIAPEQLRDGRFAEWAGRRMQQAVWCRDVSDWARGGAARKQDVAAALFDWTTRYVQLASESAAVFVHHPWQAMLYGLGTAELRAWVFVELCRQQQIDAVVLGTLNEEGVADFWLPAALIDGKLYLFDTELGLPLPSPSGGVAATLQEVVDDPDLLSRFDVEDELDYGPEVSDLQRVVAWVVASPQQLSRRYDQLQARLEGPEFVVLSAQNESIVKTLQENPAVAEVELWSLPLESIVDQYQIKPSGRKLAIEAFEPYAVRPRLWKARVLHFLGRKEVPIADRDDPLAEPQLGHTEAALLYQDSRLMPPASLLSEIDAENRGVFEATKAAATYWLGLLSYDRRSYLLSARWLGDALPEVEDRGAWANGARYNLARAWEAMGELGKAIELLESTPADAPQRHGNWLRAQQLRETQRQAASQDASTTPETAGETEG